MKNIQIQHCCPACEEISGADTTQCPKCNMRLGKVSTKNTINRYIHILEQGPANTPEDGVYTEQLMIAGLVNAV